jgi:uncharacterized iron-regulated membrane protein
MRKTFTLSMLWLHTWAGLIIGWLLFSIWVAGTLCVFWYELDYWARPEQHAVPVAERSVLIDSAVAHLQRTAPDARRWVITLPSTNGRDPVLRTSAPGNPSATARFLPDNSGRQVTTRTLGGRFFVDFHWTLNQYPSLFPFFVVGLAGVAFMLMCISGIVVHKRIFKDFFTFRPASSRQRKWLDAHNVLGVLPLPFHFLIALTGVSYFSFMYLPNAVATIYKADAISFQTAMGRGYFPDLTPASPGQPAPLYPLLALVDRAETQFGRGLAESIQIAYPGRDNAVVEVRRGYDGGVGIFDIPGVAFNGVTGDVIRDAAPRSAVVEAWDQFTALHFAFFGGSVMRWLYLICGFAGTATIGTGLLLFTIKRAKKHGSAERGTFQWVADRMNVAAIAGPMLASIGFLWVVRLLPLDMAQRTDWEVRSFYSIWFCSLVYAFIRRPARSWVEHLSLTGLLCVGLPVLGFFVPNSSLPFSISHGDWVTAGVDLSSVAFGLGFIGVARYMARRRSAPARSAESLAESALVRTV